MKKNYAIVALLIACFAGLTAKADYYETVTDGLWTNPSTWSSGVLPQMPIGAADTVVIGTEVVLMTSLGLTNYGLIVIDGGVVQIVGTPSGGTKIRNRGKIKVINGGTVTVMPITTGTENDLHNELTGLIDIVDGTLTNAGKITNEETITILPLGILRNYGTIAGFDGTPSVICGQIINNGTIINEGTYDDGSCAGLSVWSGSPIQDGIACEAPDGLNVIGTLSDGFTFNWAHVPGAVYYIVGVRENSASSFHTRFVAAPISSADFGPAPAGVGFFEWGVITVCEVGEVDFGNATMTSASMTARLEASAQTFVPALDVTVYPNPVSERLNVSVDRALSGATIELFSLSGQLVLTENVDVAAAGDVITVGVTDMSEGMYLIRVSDDVSVYQENVMISR